MNPEYVNAFTAVHFFLWVIIGILYPNRYDIVILISFLWEIFEYYMVQYPMTYKLLQQYWFIPEKYWNEGIINKITDVIANITGYYFASSIVTSKYKEHVFYFAFILWIITIIYSKHNPV